MITGHGGNIHDVAVSLGCDPSDIVDMSSNLNPLGPPQGLVKFLKDNIDTIISLPEVTSKKITGMLARRYGVDHECVLAGNGTTQFIYSIPKALRSTGALVVGPSYADYKDACAMHNVPCRIYVADEAAGFRPDIEALEDHMENIDTVFICNPNNPTGVLLDNSEIETLAVAFPETYFVIDESYLPFAVDSYRKSAFSLGLPNIIVLNSMSKVFRIPGLRVGFILVPVHLADSFNRFVQPWSVNALAQAAVLYILEKKEMVDRFLYETQEYVKNEKRVFFDALESVEKISFFPGDTYFVLAKLNGTMNAADLHSALLQHKILVRDCSNFYGLNEKFIRFSLKDRDTNMKLAELIRQILV